MEVNVVFAFPALAVVVEFEVTGLLRETKDVEKVVVLVGCVEELGDGRVDVRFVIRFSRVVGVLECIGCTGRSWQIDVFGFPLRVAPIALGDAVVASCGLVGRSAVALPAEFAGFGVEWVLKDNPRTFSRIV